MVSLLVLVGLVAILSTIVIVHARSLARNERKSFEEHSARLIGIRDGK